MASRSQVPSTLSVRICSVAMRVTDGIDVSSIANVDNPNGATCYGLSASAMVNWIADFSNTYHSKTGV